MLLLAPQTWLALVLGMLIAALASAWRCRRAREPWMPGA